MKKIVNLQKIVNLKTRAEYDRLMKILEDKGYKWQSGSKLTENDYWKDYGENFCLDLIETEKIINGYADIEYYQKEGHQILSLQEYLE